MSEPSDNESQNQTVDTSRIRLGVADRIRGLFTPANMTTVGPPRRSFTPLSLPAIGASPAVCPPAGPPAIAEPRGPQIDDALTVAQLVADWQTVDRSRTRSVIWLGRRAYAYVRVQSDRAAAVRQVQQALLAAGLRGEAGHVNRHIALYWVSELFGRAEADSIGVTTLRNLIRLCARDPKTERYQIRPQVREAAVAIWKRILAEKLNAEAVREEVARVLPPRMEKASKRITWRDRAKQILRRLAPDQIDEMIALCEELKAAKQPMLAAG